MRLRKRQEKRPKQKCHAEPSGNRLAVRKGVSTRKGDTAVHLETHISVSIRGKQSETFVVTDSEWMGACPAGMQPGDMIDKDGKLSHYKSKAP